jgi:hypothetical protein
MPARKQTPAAIVIFDFMPYPFFMEKTPSEHIEYAMTVLWSYIINAERSAVIYDTAISGAAGGHSNI